MTDKIYQILSVLGCFVLLGGICLTLVSFFWTEDATVVVENMVWSYELQIQDFKPRYESNWEEDVPSDAYNIEWSYIERGSSHDWWGTYTVDRWRYVRSEYTGGGFRDRRVWPEPRINGCRPESPVYGCERYGRKIAEYLLWFHRIDDVNTPHYCYVTEEFWLRQRQESLLIAPFRKMGGSVFCTLREFD